MAGEFDGKIVVISGASRGIGRGIALAFAREGAQTVLASSSEQNLAAAAKAVAAEGPQPLTVAGDLRKLEACEQLFRRVNERFQRCDVLVNNAGATRAGAFLDLPDAVWLDGFALKFFGCVRLTRLFWPLLKASQGSVVNIVGGAARTPDAEFLIAGAVPVFRARAPRPGYRHRGRWRRDAGPPLIAFTFANAAAEELARARGRWSDSKYPERRE